MRSPASRSRTLTPAFKPRPAQGFQAPRTASFDNVSAFDNLRRGQTSDPGPIQPPEPQNQFGMPSLNPSGSLLQMEAATRPGTYSSQMMYARDYVAQTWGLTDVGGYGTRPNPTDHDDYRAWDFMTRDLNSGWGLTKWHIDNADKLRVKYIIWQNQIWNPTSGWRAYDGPNPHTDHVHVSYY